MSGTETTDRRTVTLVGRRRSPGVAILLLLVGIAIAVLAAPSITTPSSTTEPQLSGQGVDRAPADDHCRRLLDAIVVADMGGGMEARRAARSALRASSCRVGTSAEPR